MPQYYWKFQKPLISVISVNKALKIEFWKEALRAKNVTSKIEQYKKRNSGFLLNSSRNFCLKLENKMILSFGIVNHCALGFGLFYTEFYTLWLEECVDYLVEKISVPLQTPYQVFSCYTSATCILDFRKAAFYFFFVSIYLTFLGLLHKLVY